MQMLYWQLIEYDECSIPRNKINNNKGTKIQENLKQVTIQRSIKTQITNHISNFFVNIGPTLAKYSVGINCKLLYAKLHYKNCMLWTNDKEEIIRIMMSLNSLRPRQNGRHFADDTFRRILLNENIWTWLKNSLKIVPKVRINNIPALVQIMAWRRPGDKPLSEPMMVRLLTHICVTRPQWVKQDAPGNEEIKS